MLALWTLGAVDQDGMALVDPAGDIGVPAGAEDGRGAGVRVDPGEVGRRKGEAALRVIDRPGVGEEEGAPGLVEAPVLAAEYQGAELE